MNAQTSLQIELSPEANNLPKKYCVREYRAQYVKERGINSKIIITNNRDVHAFLQQCAPMFDPVESVAVIALNTGNRIIGYEIIKGAVNQSAIYPANVFRFLLSVCANAFILAHNHPGGSLVPSGSDWKLTKRLKDIGAGLDVHLLDHLIITDDTIKSMRDMTKWDG